MLPVTETQVNSELALLVRAVAVGRQRTTEFRGGEVGDLVCNTQFDRGVVESGHCFIDPAQQAGLLGNEVVVDVEAAHRDQENLALIAQRIAGGDLLGNHLELVRQ